MFDLYKFEIYTKYKVDVLHFLLILQIFAINHNLFYFSRKHSPVCVYLVRNILASDYQMQSLQNEWLLLGVKFE